MFNALEFKAVCEEGRRKREAEEAAARKQKEFEAAVAAAKELEIVGRIAANYDFKTYSARVLAEAGKGINHFMIDIKEYNHSEAAAKAIAENWELELKELGIKVSSAARREEVFYRTGYESVSRSVETIHYLSLRW